MENRQGVGSSKASSLCYESRAGRDLVTWSAIFFLLWLTAVSSVSTAAVVALPLREQVNKNQTKLRTYNRIRGR